jgi:hypothetical protein
MRATKLFGLGLLTLIACSSEGKDRPEVGTGGGISIGSGGASTGSGGASSNHTGGSIVISMGGGPVGGRMGCNDLTVVPKPVTPTVLLLVDNSSSMFDTPQANPPWPVLYSALMDATMGVVAPLQDKVRFGFASYKGSTMVTMETDPTCATITSVPYALNNFAAIDTVYKQLSTQFMPGTKWETPTGHAVNRVAADLAAFQADPPGPKYILLVTDGNPNTCQVVDPQCGSDLSIKAVQDAKAQGIGTFAIGIGDLITGNTGCEPAWGRCGRDHLQDIANAGAGLPVQAPPEQYVWQSCADRYGRVLQGSYAAAGATPGAAPYFTATNRAELKTALQGLLNSVLSCTFDMNATVTGNPALGSVAVGATPAPYNDANGWRLEDNKFQVTLQGSACTAFKAGGTELHISFPCDVAVPR